MRFGLPLSAYLALAACRSAPSVPSETELPHRLGDIEVTTRDIFSEEEASARPLYRLFNGLHVPTQPGVIRRAMWFEEGDEVTASEVQELERNLRNSGLFGEVDAALVETDEPGVSDLTVATRDRFSLQFGASGLFVGGVSGFQASAGEFNLFGKGDRITAFYRENSKDEVNASLAYTDRYLLDSLHRGRVEIGRTEEGERVQLSIDRPLQHLADPISWGFSAGIEEDEVDYFDGGESVAEVPNDATRARLYGERSWGPRFGRKALGFEVRYEDVEYGAATGDLGGTIDVPNDISSWQVGPYARVASIDSFREVEGIDRLDFTQDLELGVRTELFLGATVREEQGFDRRVEPTAVAEVRGAFAPARDTYVTLLGAGAGRWYAGDEQGLTASAALHAYRLFEHQTLAASVTFDRVFEAENLPLQLTLGEDNGLRGYPSREFSGTRRIRVNVEDRISTAWELRSFHFGLVTFADAAWIGDDSFGEPLTAVGIGVRIGSSEITGPGVLRIDFAVPLSDRGAEDYGPTASIALGQVFSFFGNSSSLPGR